MFSNKQQQRAHGPMGPPTPPISPFNDLAIAADAKPAKSTRFLGRILNGKLSADTVSHPSTTKRSASRPTNRYGLPPPKVRHEDSNGVSDNVKGAPTLRTATSVDQIRAMAPTASLETHHSHGLPNGVRSRKNSNANMNKSATQPPIFSQRHIPALQAKQLRNISDFEPVPVSDLLPDSFDLVPSGGDDGPIQSALEQQSELLFSKFHLSVIFQDFVVLRRFISFLATVRPQSLPLLEYYLRSVKALAAVNYANSVAESLDPVTYHGQSLAFTETKAQTAETKALGDKIAAAFQVLARDDLPAFITHIWMELVETSMRRRITGSLPAHLRDLSEGLAETFCLTDPSKADNPIVFASDEFYRTTQYGTTYAIGRNCRFLQGPKTNAFAVRRIKEKCDAGQEHYETFLNYRRDGSPFMNLLMCTPLKDRTGRVRYFLGAQVDVSGLAEDLAGLDYLKHAAYGPRPDDNAHRARAKKHEHGTHAVFVLAHNAARCCLDNEDSDDDDRKLPRLSPEEGFKEFSEMLNDDELEIVRRHGGRMHHPEKDPSKNKDRRRLVLYPDDMDDQPGGADNEDNDDDDDDNGHRGRRRRGEVNMNHGYGGAVKMMDDFLFDGMATTTTTTIPIERSPSPVSISSCVTGHSLTSGGHLGGIYENYILVRPAPSLRILFASPSLRIPGLLQSCLLDRIGGPARIRDKVVQALVEGQGVTANIRWIAKPDLLRSHNNNNAADPSVGKPRWLHATPLLSASRAVGVWMVVLVDDDGIDAYHKRTGLQAPRAGHGHGHENGMNPLGLNGL